MLESTCHEPCDLAIAQAVLVTNREEQVCVVDAKSTLVISLSSDKRSKEPETRYVGRADRISRTVFTL
jgi:hypothetical protein